MSKYDPHLPQIIEVVAEGISNCAKTENFDKLFTKDAKITFETVKKESRDHVVSLLKEKQSINTPKGPFTISKYSFVVIEGKELLVNGIAQWGTDKYILTILFQIKGEVELQISNIIFAKPPAL